MKFEADIFNKAEKEVIKYKDWLIQKYNVDTYSEDTFNEWWTTLMQPILIKLYFEWLDNINCKQYHNLLFDDDKFFENIVDYMEKNNWKWYNKDDIIYTILTLSFNSANEDCYVSTGGFEVYFKPYEHLNVRFVDDKVLFEKSITRDDLIYLKLKKRL